MASSHFLGFLISQFYNGNLFFLLLNFLWNNVDYWTTFTRLCYIMRLQLSVNDYRYKKNCSDCGILKKETQIVNKYRYSIFWDSSQSSVCREHTDTVYLSYQVTNYIHSSSQLMCTIKKTLRQFQWKFFYFC